MHKQGKLQERSGESQPTVVVSKNPTRVKEFIDKKTGQVVSREDLLRRNLRK